MPRLINARIDVLADYSGETRDNFYPSSGTNGGTLYTSWEFFVGVKFDVEALLFFSTKRKPDLFFKVARIGEPSIKSHQFTLSGTNITKSKLLQP